VRDIGAAACFGEVATSDTCIKQNILTGKPGPKEGSNEKRANIDIEFSERLDARMIRMRFLA